jgi:hypothetical protein
MRAAGKKNRLKMKYPMKLWPFRPATRAGQNAIAIQMRTIKIVQRKIKKHAPLSVRRERSNSLPDGSVGTGRLLEEHPPIPLPGSLIGACISRD